jgi:hypothetical protein
MKITEHDFGKMVLLRDGSLATIVGHSHDGVYPYSVEFEGITINVNERGFTRAFGLSTYDVVGFLAEPPEQTKITDALQGVVDNLIAVVDDILPNDSSITFNRANGVSVKIDKL